MMGKLKYGGKNTRDFYQTARIKLFKVGWKYVWGCISYHSVGRLIEVVKTLDSFEYIYPIF